MFINSGTITQKELLSFTKQVFQKIGCSVKDAVQAAEILVRADMRGIYSHGVNRLPEYINLWRNERVNIPSRLKIVRETLSTALLDGDKGLGLVTAPFAMNLAIEKAKEVGSAWVSVRNSYHFGIAGYYAMMALEHDMIGIAMTNANPLVAPTYSKKAALGTNPYAIAFPTKNENPFVADLATAPINRGKLDEWDADGKEVPFGLVQDWEGKESNEANVLSRDGAIKTLGFDKVHGEHKGYCLSATVDILSAVLSGANFGPMVVPTLSYVQNQFNAKDKGIGHLFGAIRIDAFQEADEFKSSMDEWIQTFKNLPAKEGKRVLIPGEPELENEIFQERNGISLPNYVLKKLELISEEFHITQL